MDGAGLSRLFRASRNRCSTSMPAGRRSSAAKHGANLAQVRTAIATMKNAPVNAVTTGGSPTRAASAAENAVAPAIRRVPDLVCWHNPHLPEQKLRLAANRHPSVGVRLDSGSPGLNGCSGSAFRKMVLSMYGRPRVVNRPTGARGLRLRATGARWRKRGLLLFIPIQPASSCVTSAMLSRRASLAV